MYVSAFMSPVMMTMTHEPASRLTVVKVVTMEKCYTVDGSK